MKARRAHGTEPPEEPPRSTESTSGRCAGRTTCTVGLGGGGGGLRHFKFTVTTQMGVAREEQVRGSRLEPRAPRGAGGGDTPGPGPTPPSWGFGAPGFRAWPCPGFSTPPVRRSSPSSPALGGCGGYLCRKYLRLDILNPA
ncbi:hypothetical protein NHX12_010475 [Muraenolepis orangiensis]|uniref:Uncharacterized protein n=1 Tax=Muraenolepis orangiensis TaxID=630683 RepID=A0A9Q0IAH0_9TELE|nr:hypothetical protein NHX12_010475 [Muraenolepis orangiensis]